MKTLVLYINNLTMDCNWKTMKTFGMFIKKLSLDTFWGIVTFGCSLFSGFIRRQKHLTLLF